MGAPRDRGELIAGAVGDFHPPRAGQREQLLQGGAAALGEDRDLVDAPRRRAEQLEHGIAPEEGRALLLHRLSLQVVPSRLSSSTTFIVSSSARNRSASAKSRFFRASSRSHTSDSMWALSRPSTGGAASTRASSKPSEHASVTSSPAPMRNAPAPALPSLTCARAPCSVRARSKSTPSACGLLKSSSMAASKRWRSRATSSKSP